jgi:tetratricopeptide (TPR) repeat protein
MNNAIGWLHYYARRYEEAIAEIQKPLEMDSSFTVSHWTLGLSYAGKGMEREALREVGEAVRISGEDPFFLAALGRVQAMFGHREQAEQTLARLEALRTSRYVSSYFLAAIPAALGDSDRAFALLERAFEERSHGLTFLGIDPGVDPLRSDPRFQAMLARVGISLPGEPAARVP